VSVNIPAKPATGQEPAVGGAGGRPPAGARKPAWRGLIEEYRARLPVTPATPVVTLLEGATPLVPAPTLSARTGCTVLLKVEGANPTGSFKDRGMTVAVSKAVEAGAKAVICASTGNTSASAAAYAARAGITCAVLVPEGKVALGKLAQALVHGATVLTVEGSFDDCLVLTRDLAARYPVTLVNSVNPDRIQGQKTVAFEIVEALGRAPDVHCIPVGNAGNITATWLGYGEALAAGDCGTRPAMRGFQAAGAAPLVLGRPVPKPSTIATAIRIGNPASADGARRAVAESGGGLHAVTDRQILAAYRILAREEAVFVEMASAAGVAGLLALAADGTLARGSLVVCTVTGNGLKDPDWAVAGAGASVRVAPDPALAAAALGL
jgi:threonine synthase